MRSEYRKAIACAAVASALVSGGAASAAEVPAYPERPVRLVLGFAPGGTADALARILTPKLHEALGRPWVVDNRGGASGNLSTEIVANGNPDGLTVLLALSSQITVSPLLYKLPVDTEKDLKPVILLANSQYMLVVNPSVKAGTIKDLIETARTQKKPLNYASAGIGSPHHLAAELLKLRAGIQMTHVPYKGGGPASAAVLGNEVQVLFGSVASLLPHVKSGRVKALGMTSLKRSAVAPEVPTMAESGFPGFNVTSWFGLLVPARTPDRIVKIIYDTNSKIIAMPDVREAALRVGLEADDKGPEALRSIIGAEIQVWRELIKSAGIRID